MNGTLPLIFEVQHPVGAEKSLTLKMAISCYIVPEKRGKKLCLEEIFSVCSVYVLWKYVVQVIMVSSTCAPLLNYK